MNFCCSLLCTAQTLHYVALPKQCITSRNFAKLCLFNSIAFLHVAYLIPGIAGLNYSAANLDCSIPMQIVSLQHQYYSTPCLSCQYTALSRHFIFNLLYVSQILCNQVSVTVISPSATFKKINCASALMPARLMLSSSAAQSTNIG